MISNSLDIHPVVAGSTGPDFSFSELILSGYTAYRKHDSLVPATQFRQVMDIHPVGAQLTMSTETPLRSSFVSICAVYCIELSTSVITTTERQVRGLTPARQRLKPKAAASVAQSFVGFEPRPRGRCADLCNYMRTP
jgi:hypothetical protein